MSTHGGVPTRPAVAATAHPTLVEGSLAPLSTDLAGNLRVVTSTGGGGTASIDESAFVEGVEQGTPNMGAFNDALGAVSSGVVAVQRVTSFRAGHVNLRNNAGTEIASLANPVRIDPVGTTKQPVDLFDGSGNAISSSGGALNVNLSAGTAVIGKVSIDQTTPGTTNGVQVNAALPAGSNVIGHIIADTGSTTAVTALPAIPAGTNVIGKVSIDQTTPGTTNGVQVNAALPAGSNVIGHVINDAGTAVIGKVSIDQTTPGTTNLVAAGGVGAAGASVAGNPMRTGGLGQTTLPTSVASAQLVDRLLDRYGRTYIISPVLTTKSSAGTPITTNTNTSIVAAPSAGNHLRIHRLWAQNSSATGTWCYWGNGSGDKSVGPPFFLAQNQPFGMDIRGAWELSTATALFINTATTGANIEWYVEFETLAD